MGSIFKPKTPALPPVQPLPEPPSTELSEAEQKKLDAEFAAKERRRRGRKSTIKTSPLIAMEEADVEEKTLLGSVKSEVKSATQCETKSSLSFGK